MPRKITKAPSNMVLYRRKPVIIRAIQIKELCEVDTPEGTMRGNPGDYLIQGVQGELYFCKPDIFAKIYEAIEG